MKTHLQSSNTPGSTFTKLLCLIVVANYCLIMFGCLISGYEVSQSFTDAIDAATNEYVSSDSWKAELSKHGLVYFGAPACFTPKPSYPSAMNLPSSVVGNEFVLCYEKGAGYPWESLHQSAGSFLINTLNNKYKSIDLSYRFLVLDTASGGYFPTLQSMVDNGTCTVAIASTNYDLTRSEKVHFQCRYGGSSQGWVRSNLNSTIFPIQKESDLNQTGLTIALYKGSTHDTYATKYFSASTIVRTSGNLESFDLISNEKVHVMIGDATDLYAFLQSSNGTNGEKCKGCYTKAFSDAYSFGSFTTKLITSEGSSINTWVTNINTYFVLTIIILVSLFR